MSRRVKVYFGDTRNGQDRQLLDCELVEVRATTIVVKTPDGNLVTRKKVRDLPKGDENGVI